MSVEFGAFAPEGAQSVLLGALGATAGPLAPGETITGVFELDPLNPNHRYMSYVSGVLPSNDAFVANGDPTAHEIFDAGGSFVATNFVVLGSAVLDAGTEVNDELPENTALFGQTVPDSGVAEGGVVGAHPGFLAPGMGGILDDPMFLNADFSAVGYHMLTVSFEELPPAEPATGLAAVELTSGNALVEFHVTASGLSGPLTGAHFHTGAPGVAGPVVIDLSGAIVEDSNGNVRIEGATGTTASFVDALSKGDVYVNLHTALNPSGEIRGQLTTDPAYQGQLDTAQEVPAPILGTDLRVTVQNLAPVLGTFQAPVWIGLHDGSFDVFDLGSAATTYFPVSNALEHLAEDGNATPLMEEFAAATADSTQGLLSGLYFEGGVIRPAEAVSHVFRLDPAVASHRYLSFASTILPSNDAFLANDGAMDHPVFDASGTFVGENFTIGGSSALDAGTEVNDEVPANTNFFGQTSPNTGVDELGVVALHPGFLATGMGGILDDPMFVNADFTAPGYLFLDVRLSEQTPTGPASGLVIASLDEAANEITYAVSAHSLSGPAIAMHFHRAVPGVAGPVLIDLTSSIVQNEAGWLTANGTATGLSAEFVAALKAGEIYLNVHTALNPTGEIRGQVELVD